MEKKYIPDIVTKADLNLIHGSNDGRSLLRFGISTNKMFDCFAAGKPILMDIAAGYNPVEQFYAGVRGLSEVLSQANAGLRQTGTCWDPCAGTRSAPLRHTITDNWPKG